MAFVIPNSDLCVTFAAEGDSRFLQCFFVQHTWLEMDVTDISRLKKFNDFACHFIFCRADDLPIDLGQFFNELFCFMDCRSLLL
ncbi:MAG: hypothetical protein MZV64_62510 [Ignavibacteriales bacterium]|nr:hypothetical protein [Ignavibacteriales bacterium]